MPHEPGRFPADIHPLIAANLKLEEVCCWNRKTVGAILLNRSEKCKVTGKTIKKNFLQNFSRSGRSAKPPF
jgi:hypothetical protein